MILLILIYRFNTIGCQPTAKITNCRIILFTALPDSLSPHLRAIQVWESMLPFFISVSPAAGSFIYQGNCLYGLFHIMYPQDISTLCQGYGIQYYSAGQSF